MFRDLNFHGITLKKGSNLPEVKTVVTSGRGHIMTGKEHTSNFWHDGNVRFLVHGRSYKGV